MKKLADNFANLVKVKTIVTLAVMAVFTALALKGTITADNVMIVVSTVIAFYFGTQAEKKSTTVVEAMPLITETAQDDTGQGGDV
mgnify:CR=1 FL=1